MPRLIQTTIDGWDKDSKLVPSVQCPICREHLTVTTRQWLKGLEHHLALEHADFTTSISIVNVSLDYVPPESIRYVINPEYTPKFHRERVIRRKVRPKRIVTIVRDW